MIIGYIDNIHFDLFYDQETKKAIYSTKKKRKENLYMEYVISKIYIISLPM